MNLSVDQQCALDAFNVEFPRNNVLLTGPGGSGKTALIKQMVEEGEAAGKNVQVCALTGCAAVLLGCKGSKTVHSWAGVGLATGPHGKVVDKVIKNKHKSSGWKKVDVLIIDEISMMSKKLFNILDSIGRKVRGGPDVPFGGIQVVFSGDFYQLPPVGDRDDEETSAFCFESDNWKSTFHKTVQLTTIFRQTDLKYTKILSQIRVGKLKKSSYETLMTHVGKEIPEDSIIKPTILFPKRRDVDLINSDEMSKLNDESHTFELSTDIVLTPAERMSVSQISDAQREMELRFLTNNIRADKTLVLKKGAQVMCVANIDMEGPYPIVNGSQGIIVDFMNKLPLVLFNDGQQRIIGYHEWKSENVPGLGVKQIPLILAWAITIHKAQGVTLEMAQIDAGSNIFECGQTYVALSRVKSLEGLYLTAFNPGKIKVNKKVQKYYESLIVKLLKSESK
jgi:ATP-dependent DNA helicase PIF1